MKLLALTLVALVMSSFASGAIAADNPTGTWKWSMTNQKGTAVESTLKLKLEGDKLTGALVGRNNETAIEDGKFADGEVSFTVTRERNGTKMTQKYSGKLSGDTIKGKIENTGGKGQPRDWEAKKSAE